MFNFTTQTIFNDVVKATVADIKGGKKGYNLIVGTDEKPEVRFGNIRFTKDVVESIQMKKPTKENLARVTFDLAKIVEKASESDVTARIALYVGLSMNSQDSFYANDYVYKGKPFYIEFYAKKGEGVDVVAKRAKAIADKYLLFTTPQKIFNVTIDATAADSENNTAAKGTITFKCVDGYQQIKKAELQWYNPEAKTIDCCTMDGDFEVIVSGVPVVYTLDEEGKVVELGDGASEQKMLEDRTLGGLDDNEVAIYPGLEAFGDYNWMIHNLRLPTAANYYPWSIANQMGEMPVPGQSYTQFIITMKAVRDGIAGGVVGQKAISVTTHVLYVVNSKAQDVKTELAKLVGGDNNIKTDADDKLTAPYKDA